MNGEMGRVVNEPCSFGASVLCAKHPYREWYSLASSPSLAQLHGDEDFEVLM